MFSKHKDENIKLRERCYQLEKQIEIQEDSANRSICFERNRYKELEKKFRLIEQEKNEIIRERDKYKEKLYEKEEFSKKYKVDKVEKEEIRQSTEQQWLDNFHKNLDKYYYLENTILYTTEQDVFYCLNRIFDKKTSWDSKQYKVFPKIRLVDFINTLDQNKDTSDYLYRRYIVGNVTSKHVDFLVCEFISDGRNSKYKPVLVIEVNGKSHKTNSRTIENDIFKKELFKAYNFKNIWLDLEDGISKLSEYTSVLEEKIKNELLDAVISI